MRKVIKLVKKSIGVVFLKTLGWSVEDVPKEVGDKYVLIGFPHTTNMDLPLGVAYSLKTDIITSPMMKKEWFFFPMNLLFRALHVIPIDRSSSHNVVDQIAEQFKKRDKFVPAIMPEGTRSEVKTIKTGFWYIAQKADVPIVLLYKDDKVKKIKILAHLKVSDSIDKDIEKISKIYKDAGYTIPLKRK